MPWFNASWLYRFKVTSQNAQVDEAIDNVFYDLANAPAGFWTHVNATDGRDIRVTQSDGTTEVAREVSGFNQGSSLGSLFFKATGLSAVADTDFYVYYGNAGASEPGASDANGKNNVWTSYLAVFHLDEASGNVTCSKSGVTGTNVGVALAATGKLRTAGDFVDTTDEITAGDNFDVTAAALSISAWINPDTADALGVIVCKSDGDSTDGYRFMQANSTSRLRLQIGDATAATNWFSDSSIITTALQHVAAVMSDSSTVTFYRNGAAVGGTIDGSARTPTNGAGTFTIGNFSDFNFNQFVGILDEIRVSTSIRSANWWTTEYNNQNSPGTFWATAAEEQNAVQLTWLPQVRGQGGRTTIVPSGQM